MLGTTLYAQIDVGLLLDNKLKGETPDKISSQFLTKKPFS